MFIYVATSSQYYIYLYFNYTENYPDLFRKSILNFCYNLPEHYILWLRVKNGRKWKDIGSSSDMDSINDIRSTSDMDSINDMAQSSPSAGLCGWKVTNKTIPILTPEEQVPNNDWVGVGSGRPSSAPPLCPSCLPVCDGTWLRHAPRPSLLVVSTGVRFVGGGHPLPVSVSFCLRGSPVSYETNCRRFQRTNSFACLRQSAHPFARLCKPFVHASLCGSFFTARLCKLVASLCKLVASLCRVFSQSL